MSDKAYILHSFSRLLDGHCLIYLIGRLENGETFGFVERNFLPFFYIRESDRANAGRLIKSAGLHYEFTSRTCLDGERVLLLRHMDKQHLRKTAEKLSHAGIRTYEADVKTEQQYLMESGLRSTCRIDGQWLKGQGVNRLYRMAVIEPSEAKVSLSSVVLEAYFENECLVAFSLTIVPSSQDEKPVLIASGAYHNEKKLLSQLHQALRDCDPDVLCGWKIQKNILLPLQKRFQHFGLCFDLGRSRAGKWFLEKQYRGRELVVVQGRQVLDIEELMEHTWERYSESTPESIIKDVLHESVPEAGIGACDERGRLLAQLLLTKNLVDLSLRRSLLTGLSLERCWGSIASFEYLYMQELHKRSFVAPTLGIDRILTGSSPGGLVMEPEAGLHKNIFVFDFKSLYPSIIRTFNIDPLAYARAMSADSDVIEVPNGVQFDRRPAILPQILERFFASRQDAKDASDELASFVCKILMNSFFGVLGTNGCRFAQGPLVAAVSQTGHYLLRWMRSHLEKSGFRVLYGDTDSLFVDLGVKETLTYEMAREKGLKIEASLNADMAQHLHKEFGLQSCLELEFEKYYTDFFQPSMRHSKGRGRAKSYAARKAVMSGTELEIIGLEAVRRDWTDLAQELQRNLLDKVFSGCGTSEIEESVQNIIEALKAGELDEKLIYRKKLSKSLESYTKTTPPHVKAARLLEKVPQVIFYMMTGAGPQPVGQLTHSLNYQHYIDKQIIPIVKSIAEFSNFSWQRACLVQGNLFDGMID